MPCPQGVAIPRCFELYDDTFLFPENRFTFFRYHLQLGGVMGEPTHAGLCTACGKCQKKCPQSLPIPDLLAKLDGEMDRAWVRPVTWAMGRFMAFQRWAMLRKAPRAE